MWKLYEKAQTPYNWHKHLFNYSKKIHNSGTLNYSLNIVLSEGDVISVTTDPGNTPTQASRPWRVWNLQNQAF